MPIGAIIGAVGSIGGAVIGGLSAKSAANTQAAAATQASQTQLQMYQQTRSDLAPYLSTGTAAMNQIAQLLGIGGGAAGGAGGAPNAMSVNGTTTVNGKQVTVGQPPQNPASGTAWIDNTGTLRVWDQSAGRWGEAAPAQAQQWLGGATPQSVIGQVAQSGGGTGGTTASDLAQATIRNYPGYQFQLGEGLRATDQGAAARGMLATPGQQQAEATFGQGLASSAWQDYMNRLSGLTSLGENAGAQTGNAGATAAAGAAQSQIAAGQASAAGTIGFGNALTSGINNGIGVYSRFANPSGGIGSYAVDTSQAIANSGGADVGSIF